MDDAHITRVVDLQPPQDEVVAKVEQASRGCADDHSHPGVHNSATSIDANKPSKDAVEAHQHIEGSLDELGKRCRH